jgi:hypothetical protein
MVRLARVYVQTSGNFLFVGQGWELPKPMRILEEMIAIGCGINIGDDANML